MLFWFILFGVLLLHGDTIVTFYCCCCCLHSSFHSTIYLFPVNFHSDHLFFLLHYIPTWSFHCLFIVPGGVRLFLLFYHSVRPFIFGDDFYFSVRYSTIPRHSHSIRHSFISIPTFWSSWWFRDSFSAYAIDTIYSYDDCIPHSFWYIYSFHFDLVFDTSRWWFWWYIVLMTDILPTIDSILYRYSDILGDAFCCSFDDGNFDTFWVLDLPFTFRCHSCCSDSTMYLLTTGILMLHWYSDIFLFRYIRYIPDHSRSCSYHLLPSTYVIYSFYHTLFFLLFILRPHCSTFILINSILHCSFGGHCSCVPILFLMLFIPDSRHSMVIRCSILATIPFYITVMLLTIVVPFPTWYRYICCLMLLPTMPTGDTTICLFLMDLFVIVIHWCSWWRYIHSHSRWHSYLRSCYIPLIRPDIRDLFIDSWAYTFTFLPTTFYDSPFPFYPTGDDAGISFHSGVPHIQIYIWPTLLMFYHSTFVDYPFCSAWLLFCSPPFTIPLLHSRAT